MTELSWSNLYFRISAHNNEEVKNLGGESDSQPKFHLCQQVQILTVPFEMDDLLPWSEEMKS